jgi:hypothetical protein
MYLAVHIARLARTAVAQEPRELTHRLPRLLVGDTVDRDDRDAIGGAHHIQL